MPAGKSKLLAAPSFATVLLVVDTLAKVVRGNSIDAVHNGDEKWCGIAAHGDRLFCAPGNPSGVLVINSADDSVTIIEQGSVLKARTSWNPA